MTPDPILAALLGALRWLLAAALVATSAARLARTLVSRHARPGYLEWFVLTALLLAGSVAALGFSGWLAPSTLLLAAAGLFLLTLPLRPPHRGQARPGGPPRAALVVAVLALLPDLSVYLPTPPTNWDAMTYHLYFPARWIQEGRIFHIPTVFSDNAAAFAPQNGALLFAWSMALLRSDALCNVLQLLASIALAVAVYRLARGLGAAAPAAALAGATAFWIRPLRAQVDSADVDAWMLAFWAAGLVWLVEYLRRPRARPLLLCGLAAGLAAGTKTVGLSLALVEGVAVGGLALGRRRPLDLLPFAAAATAGGGWWYLRNLVLYGNPVFPLRVALGPWTLPGAYGLDAIRAGEFHVPPATLPGLLVARWGWPVCVLLVLGLLALGGAAIGMGRRRVRRRAWAAALLCAAGVAWAAWYAWMVPHNGQTRFLLPSLLIALVGWGLILHRAGRWRRWAGAGLGLGAILLVALLGRPDAEWLPRLHALHDAGVALSPIVAGLFVIGAAGAGYAGIRPATPRLVLGALLTLACAETLALGTVAAETSRPTLFLRAGFRTWAEGYLPFHDPRLPPQRVAYSGANIPYTLMGPRFRHTVLYCNTRGEAREGFYEFWRRNPRRYAYHKPGLYRGADDSYERWLAHLEEERIDVVVLFALHPVERRYLPTTEAGFPPEQRWIAEHPERFETILRGRFAEIHRLRGP